MCQNAALCGKKFISEKIIRKKKNSNDIVYGGNCYKGDHSFLKTTLYLYEFSPLHYEIKAKSNCPLNEIEFFSYIITIIV